MEQIDENGECPLHPSMQLQSRKKNGDWRVLMTCCPLCVSGLPADGMSIGASRYSRDDDDLIDNMHDGEDHDDGEQVGAASGGSRMEERPAPCSPEDLTSPLSLKKVDSYDTMSYHSGETTDDDASVSSQNVYQDFRNFIEVEQGQQTLQTTISSQTPSSKVGNNSHDSPKPRKKPSSIANNNKANNSHVSPIPNRRSPKPKPSPRPMSPDPTKHYLPNARPRQFVMNQQHNHFPVPPNQKLNGRQQQQQCNNNSPPNPNRMGMKRPDPESIGHQGPFIHNTARGYGNNRVHMSPHQMSSQHYHHLQHAHLTPHKQFHPPPYHTELSPHQKQQQHNMTPPPHPQTRQLPYSTSKQTNDEISVNSATLSKSRSLDPDEEISVSSMSSVKRNLYNSAPSLIRHQSSPYPIPLEQDEVSAVSMSSVTRNLYNNKSNETSDEEDDEKDSSSSNQDNNEENISTTAQYDSKGRCIRHPTVRLRKKKLFGGWQIVLSNCPECCLDEIRKVVKDDRSKSSKSKKKSSSKSLCGSESGRSKASSGTKSKKKKKSGKKQHRRDKERKDPPMSQVNINGGGEDDKSVGTASTITISSHTHASHNGRTIKNWQEYTSEQGAGPACVTRMPFIDRHGEHGWYTGCVDGTTGSPHGFGTMNFSNRVVAEGQWRNGLFVAEDQPSVNSPANVRYPPQQHHGFVRRPSHHNIPTPRSPLETHYEEASLSNNSARSRSNARGRQARQSPPTTQNQTAMIQNQQHRKVVCGMFWTTSTGNGAYTGEVNGLNIPDGVGSMRYNTGMVVEGLWRDGEMTEDANEDEEEEEEDCRSYSDGNIVDDYVRENGRHPRRNGSSASVM